VVIALADGREGGAMQSLLWGVAVLACPVGMGAMMWMMMRGQGNGTGEVSERQVAQLRAEIDQLKADRVAQRTTDRR
jgi:hypothetical protein